MLNGIDVVLLGRTANGCYRYCISICTWWIALDAILQLNLLSEMMTKGLNRVASGIPIQSHKATPVQWVWGAMNFRFLFAVFLVPLPDSVEQPNAFLMTFNEPNVETDSSSE